MDLLDENRALIHTGKLLRQPETGFEWNGWSELFVLLFDNYREAYHNSLILLYLTPSPVVMTKPKEKDGTTKYNVTRRVSVFDICGRWKLSSP
jgi:RHO1 GDP-GTP exchange protein 1/2